MNPAHDFARLRQEIPLLQHLTYLNTGYTGPMPEPVDAAVRQWRGAWYASGLTTPEGIQMMNESLDRARSAVAGLLHCESAEIALLDNTSDGINVIANGLPWSAGDEVITSDLEHPAGLLPWFLLAKTKGIKVHVLKLAGHEASMLDLYEQHIGPRTRVVCLSHVLYSTGMRMPVPAIAELAHRVGALCLVDGAQAVGQIDVNVAALDCDAYSLPGQKWLLGPSGTGALYLHRSVLERIGIHDIGFLSISRFHIDGEYVLKPSAQRYEGATKPWDLLVGLAAAIEYMNGFGRQAAYARMAALQRRLRLGLQQIAEVELTGAPDDDAYTSLVCFNLRGHDPERLFADLWQRERIVTRWVPFPRAMRACVHAFNTEEDIQRLLDALIAATRGATRV